MERGFPAGKLFLQRGKVGFAFLEKENTILRKGAFMKKFTLFAILALCVLLPAGCGNKQQKSSEDTELSTGNIRTSVESTELISLRSTLVEKDCMLGIGFLGYIGSESDEKTVREYVTDSTLAESYPFLKECVPVLLEGAELYALVPAGEDTVITVSRTELSEDGNYIDDKAASLYTSKPGETVVLRCNLSEICANVLISVKDGTGTLEFHPMLSMMDGHVVAEYGCYDISEYDDDYESIENAHGRLLEIDEVRDALERGMRLLYTGDMQMVEGQSCLIFALGTDREDQFVREQIYAVSDLLVYVYLPESDRWQIVSVG